MVTISQEDGKLEVNLGKETVSVQSEANQVVKIQNNRGEKKPNLQEKESSPLVSKENSNTFRRSKKRFVRKINELKIRRT